MRDIRENKWSGEVEIESNGTSYTFQIDYKETYQYYPSTWDEPADADTISEDMSVSSGKVWIDDEAERDLSKDEIDEFWDELMEHARAEAV